MKVQFVVASMAVALAALPVSGQTNVSPAAVPPPVPDAIVARVGRTEIKRKELDLSVKGLEMQLAQRGRPVTPEQLGQLEHDVLDEMISRELVLQEGQAHVPATVDAKVKEQVASMKSQVGGDEAFAKVLQESGISPADYLKRVRDNIIVQETIEQVVEPQVKVSPEEIKDYFETNREKFKQPETVKASHILIRVAPTADADTKKAKRAQIEAARSLIKGGEKFADVAKKVSEDPGSAARGGELPPFSHGQMVPEFEMAAFALKTNELSDVITTQFGYHLLLVTDHQPAQPRSFDTVKADIEKFLKYRKGSEIAHQHVKELREKTKVEVLLPPVAAAPITDRKAVPSPTKDPAPKP